MSGAGGRVRRRSSTAAAGRRTLLKRSIDVALATGAIIVMSPVLAGIAIVLLATQGRPVLFRQKRAGLHGKAFTLVKFRTMRSPRPDEVWFASDTQRLTRAGRLLRSTSLDELPELWNVIRGDMSLVGPRPLILQYVARYTPEERRRLLVRPGLTGWAVVNGRHTLSFEDRLRFDVWYVDHWSHALDLRILVMTLAQLLRRQDVATVQDHAEIDFPERFRQALVDPAGDDDGGSVA